MPLWLFYNVQRVLHFVAGSFKWVVWLYDKVDKQKFIEKLEIVDWITLLCQFNDVDDMCNKFTTFFTFSFGQCFVCYSSIYEFSLPLWYLQTLLGWNTLPCQFEISFGKFITHVIYIIKLAEESYPVNYF
jgi:hypothetical protein